MSKSRSKKEKNGTVTVEVRPPVAPGTDRSATKKKARRRASKSKLASAPAWLLSVADPWTVGPVAIPDEQTQPSVKCTTRVLTTFQTQTSTAGTTCGSLVAILPYLMNPLNATTTNSGNGWISSLGYNGSTGVYGGYAAAYTSVVGKAPNNSAILPPIDTTILDQTSTAAYLHRLTAMSVRISYVGTEFYRAGRITTGLAEVEASYGGNGPISGGHCNGISMVWGRTCYPGASNSLSSNGGPTISSAQLANRMRRFEASRTPDGTVQVNWIPTGTPSYTAPLRTDTTMWSSALSAPVVIVAIEGDQAVTTEDTIGSTYSLEVVAHWEILPASRVALAVSPTSSIYDPQALATCLNGFQELSTTHIRGSGGPVVSIPDGNTHDSTSAWITRAGQRLANSAIEFGSSETGRALGRAILNNVLGSASAPSRRGFAMLSA